METGSTIKHAEKVRSSTRQAIHIMANGPTIKQISLEFTRHQKEPGMKGTGEMTNSMAMVLKI